MQFSGGHGQKKPNISLYNFTTQNRLSHALLFLGRGVQEPGAVHGIRQFSSAMGTREEWPATHIGGEPEIAVVDLTLTDSCGTCPSCQKASKLIHPDIHYSYRSYPGKAGKSPSARIISHHGGNLSKQCLTETGLTGYNISGRKTNRVILRPTNARHLA